MAFHPFDVDAPHLMYTILGAFTVLFGMFSLLVKEKLYLGEAPIATLVGIILGPYVLNIFDPYKWGGGNQGVTDSITLEVTRVVIAIGVFAVGVELPKVCKLSLRAPHSRDPRSWQRPQRDGKTWHRKPRRAVA